MCQWRVVSHDLDPGKMLNGSELPVTRLTDAVAAKTESQDPEMDELSAAIRRRCNQNRRRRTNREANKLWQFHNSPVQVQQSAFSAATHLNSLHIKPVWVVVPDGTKRESAVPARPSDEHLSTRPGFLKPSQQPTASGRDDQVS